MTKRTDYQGTSCQNHIQEKSVGLKKAFRPDWIFVSPPLVILANCCAHQFLFRVTCAAAGAPQTPMHGLTFPFGVWGVGAAGGTAHWLPYEWQHLAQLGGCGEKGDAAYCLSCSRVSKAWAMAEGSALLLLALWVRDQVLAFFSVVYVHILAGSALHLCYS